MFEKKEIKINTLEEFLETVEKISSTEKINDKHEVGVDNIRCCKIISIIPTHNINKGREILWIH